MTGRRFVWPLGPTALALMLVAFTAPSAAQAPALNSCPAPLLAPATPSAPAPAGSGQPAAGQVLVCVGARAIDGATYSHWLSVAAKGTSRPSEGPSPAGATELRDEVLGFLISGDWLKGEARELKVRVSRAEVLREFHRLRAQQFRRRGELGAFLHQTGQTIADLLLRVELNLTSARIQKRVVSGHHSALARERALSRFVRGFRAKWLTRTYCLPEYAVSDCGHVQSTL